MNATKKIVTISFATVFLLLVSSAMICGTDESDAESIVWESQSCDGVTASYDGGKYLDINLVETPMTNVKVLINGDQYGAGLHKSFRIALGSPLELGTYLISVTGGVTASCTLVGYTSYDVTLTQTTGGTISATPPEGPAGTVVNLSYTLTDGYKFKTWMVGGTESNENSFTLNADVTVSAIFEKIPEYKITATAGENGSITPSGEKTIRQGGSQEYVIAADPGYEIEDVKVDGSSVGAVSSYKFENIDGNHSINATFKAKAPTQFTVTISSDGHGTVSKPSVTVISGSSIIASGSTLNIGGETVTASADSGYSFSRWTGVPSGGTITGNTTITATFTKNVAPPSPGPGPTPTPTKYTVTVTTDGNGSAYASPASASSGTKVILTATPKTGSVLKEWQSSDVTISGSSFTMPSKNVAVKAVFEKAQGTVAVTGITISSSELMMKVGDSASVVASIVPADATNKKVTWSSSDPSVASVEGGAIKAMKAGTATITVTTDEGGFKATCKVTVKPADYVISVEGDKADKSELDKAIESANRNPGQDIVISGNGSSISVPSDSLKQIVDLGSTVVVRLINGDVTLPPESFSKLELDAGDELRIVVRAADAPSGFVILEGAVVVDVSMLIGDTKVTSFGSPITVAIPYEPAPGQDVSKLKVFHLADDRTVTDMGGSYDSDRKAMVFTTDHLSVYVVAESVEASSADGGDDNTAVYIAVVAVVIIILLIAAVFLIKRNH